MTGREPIAGEWRQTDVVRSSRDRPRAWSVLSAALLLAAVVLVARPGAATACSCASPHPLDVMAEVDTVFVGQLVANLGDGASPRWQFDVESVLKGEARSTEVVVADDFESGCGTPYTAEMGPIVVYADREGDDLTAPLCIPAPGIDAFRAMLSADQAPPAGTGPPAVVMSGTVGATDLAVLDEQGRTLARASVDAGRGPVVQCAGTTRVAIAAYEPKEVVIVDLVTLDVVERRPIDNDELYAADSTACLDGGDLVVVTTGFAPNTGQMRITTSNADASGADDRSAGFAEFSRGVVHPAGTVLLLPWHVDQPLRAVAADDLEPVGGGDLTLPDGTSAIDGAVSADGTRLAVLATMSGEPVDHDESATHVLMVELTAGVPIAGSLRAFGLPEPGGRLEDRFGVANQVDWLDDDTLAIGRETMSSRLVQLVGTDGTPRSEPTDIGWGWGFAPVADGFVRVRNGGVELVRRDGTTAAGDPAPNLSYVDRFLSLAPLADVPPIDPGFVADLEPVEFRPPAMEATSAPTTSIDEDGSLSPTTEDEFDDPADFPDEGDGDRSPWAVGLAIAGLMAIVLAGVAVVVRSRRE